MSTFEWQTWCGFTKLCCVFAWVRMLVISIKQINAVLFFNAVLKKFPRK